MEIILFEDVKNLGKKNDIIKVSDGYARNFILPKKLGVEATPKNLNDLKIRKAQEAKRQAEILDEAKSFCAELEQKSITVSIREGEGGKSFGSVSTKELVAAIKEQLGYDVDKKKLLLSEPIKNSGTYKLPIKLHPQVTANLKVIVNAVS
ncbi:MAG: 50S ribosomal protein L9 [Lachnospiraceae bacterium]|nr:50S ribosomal protein L9 [Lachnospiraceae bacterium]